MKEVFIEGENLDQLQIDDIRKVARIVNYKKHFVPLLGGLVADITENVKASREEVYGLGSHSFIVDTGNHDLEEQKPQVQVQLNQDSFNATDVYSGLKEVTFDSDNSDNADVWSGMDQINSYIITQLRLVLMVMN